jgi:hypothetical protein
MASLSRLFRRVASSYYTKRFCAPSRFACIRVKVRRGRWKDKKPESLADLNEAIKDLEVKPKDNGGLSLYFVRSKREACRVALMHQVTNNSPNEAAFAFLFVPATCLTTLSCKPQIVPDWNIRRQHPLLNKHHFVIYGISQEKARLEFAAAILANPSYRVESWTKRELHRRARVIIGKWWVKRFMQCEDKWRSACLIPDAQA